jgi:hypothetical protein
MNATIVSNITIQSAYSTYSSSFAKATEAVADFENVYTAEWASVIAPLSGIEAIMAFGLENNAAGIAEANTIVSMARVQHLPAAGVSAFEMAKAIGKALANDTAVTLDKIKHYALVKSEKLTRASLVAALATVGKKPSVARTDEAKATSAVNGVVKYFASLTDEQRATLRALLA